MSNPRVNGTAVHGGLRHVASGVVDGTFAKAKGDWDTNTRCGKYVNAAVETDEDLVVDCLRCLGRVFSTGSILRTNQQGDVILDEAHDYESEELNRLIEETAGPGMLTLARAGTPSGPLPPSPARPRASRR